MQYYILSWNWNGRYYEAVSEKEGNVLDEIMKVYDNIRCSKDCPLVELYAVLPTEDKRLRYKEI